MSVRSRRQAWWQRLWGLLCSRKVTAGLFGAIAAVLILGLWLPQVPEELEAAAQEAWWSATAARFGASAGALSALGLFDLFRSPTLIALLSALLLNNLACTVDRMGRLWREVARRPIVRLPEAAYRPAGPAHAGLPGGKASSCEQVRRALRQRGYRQVAEDAGRHYFYAQSPRLAPVGTLLTHLGLFLFVLAALLHTRFSWRERLVLNPASAESVALSHRPDCAVRSDSLAASREHGALLTGEVHLQIEEGGRKITGRAAPSAPLGACGVNLYYLDAFDLVLSAEAHDRAGNPLEVVFDDGTALYFSGGKEATGTFAVSAWGWRVTVNPSPEALAGSPEGMLDLQVVPVSGAMEPLSERVRVGQAWEGPWGRLTLLGGRVVEMAAVYDPGVGPFLGAGVALALGSTFSLLCLRRRRWARVDADGTLWVGGAPTGGEAAGQPAGRGGV